MNSDVTVSNKPTGAFKTFPEFSKLTLADREAYQKLVAAYPPVDDISFPSLMTWWNSFDNAAVALLNDNIVLSYWLPGMEQYNGLSIVGTKKVDESICTLFDSMIAEQKKPRLVHVPEFTVSSLEHPELFTITPMSEFDEYIVSLADLSALSRASITRLKRIEAFARQTAAKHVSVKTLDLASDADLRLLKQGLDSWVRTTKGNNFSQFSDNNVNDVFERANMLGTKNLCLFVDDELQSFMFYDLTHDKRYVNVGNIRVHDRYPHTFDYANHVFARVLVEQGATFANISHDLGLQRLRSLKLSLQPVSYFRKYTIEPAS
jgi:hypothetical protein